MKKNIPNILTITRGITVPIFFLLIFFNHPWERFWFLGLFVYASITDFLDGYLARKFNSTSLFGKIFDSISDKILVSIVLLLIAFRDKEIFLLIIIPTLLIIIREFLISGLRESFGDTKALSVSMLGKYKTTFQMISISFLILGGIENNFYLYIRYVGVVLLYISAILSIVSGVEYIYKIQKHIKIK